MPKLLQIVKDFILLGLLTGGIAFYFWLIAELSAGNFFKL